MGQTRSRDCLHGFCDEKYLPVKKHLEEMLRNGAEENLQLCVYVEGKCVIDLFGTAIRDTTYTADTLQVEGYIFLRASGSPREYVEAQGMPAVGP